MHDDERFGGANPMNRKAETARHQSKPEDEESQRSSKIRQGPTGKRRADHLNSSRTWVCKTSVIAAAAFMVCAMMDFPAADLDAP